MRRRRRRFQDLTAHGLHRLITGVHSNIGVDSTVQAMTDAVVNFAGFGAAVFSVLRPGEVMETVAVAGSQDAKNQLLGACKPRRVYDEEFDVAQRWGCSCRTNGYPTPNSEAGSRKPPAAAAAGSGTR